MQEKRYHQVLFLAALFFLWLSPSMNARAADDALSFDGVGNYVSLPQINAGTTFSVEGWFYVGTPNEYMTLFKNDYRSNDFGSIYLHNYMGGSQAQWWWVNGNRLSTTDVISTNAWHHLAFTADGTVTSLYVDGVLKTSESYSPNYNNTLDIGVSDDGTFWSGMVDDVRIYGRALSAQEVSDHHNGTFTDETGLLGAWYFDDGSGATAADSSGNGNTATVSGATWVDRGTGVPVPPPGLRVVVAQPVNYPPQINFVSFPSKLIWRGSENVSYKATDPDAGPPGALRNFPIDAYYSDNSGINWKSLTKNEENTGTYAFDSTKLPDGGDYKLKITATDGFGLVAEAISSVFAIDNTGPTFGAVVSPSGQIKETDTVDVTVTASEALKQVPNVQITQKGAKPQTLVVSGARKDFTASYKVVKGYPGEATISIDGVDLAGNSGNVITSGKTFSVNRFGPPAPVVDDIADGQIFSDPGLTVSGTAKDAVEVTLTLNGKDTFTVTPDSKGLFTFEKLALSASNNGYNTLSIFSVDKKGITSVESSFSLKLNKAPEISLKTSVNGTISGKKVLTWLASDQNSDQLSYTIEYSSDSGKNWAVFAAGIIETSYTFDSTLLFDGPDYRLKVIADDGAAKTETVSEKFSIANNATLSIFGIPTSSFLKTTTPTFSGSVSLAQNKIASVQYSLDGEIWEDAAVTNGSANVSNETFGIAFSSPLIDGKYQLSLKVTDALSNLIKTFRTFVVDTLPPVPPAITFPLADESVSKSKDTNPGLGGIQINITGKSEAGTNLQILVNSRSYETTSTNNGDFTFKNVTLLDRGINRYFLSSYDAVGNVTKVNGYIISNNPPRIFNMTPKQGDFVGKTAIIQWEAEDADGEDLTFQVFYRKKDGDWISLGHDLSATKLSWDTSRLAEGEYEVRVDTNDSLSSVSASSGSIFVDNTDPKISLEGENTILTKDSGTVFRGVASDALSGIDRVEYSFDGTNWYKALPVGGNGSSKVVFEFNWRGPLKDGDYSVRARAVDGAGNIANADPVAFTLDTTPPHIGSTMISSGALVLFPGEDGFIALLKDRTYNLSLSISRDAREASISAGGQRISLTFNKSSSLWEGTLNFKAVGKYQMNVYAKDALGNEQTKDISAVNVISGGYVYDAGSKERIGGATVSLVVFDAGTNTWPLWDGKAFGQENPQKTNENGQYEFFVPSGTYRMEVAKGGFGSVTVSEFKIAGNAFVDAGVPMTSRQGIIESIFNYFK